MVTESQCDSLHVQSPVPPRQERDVSLAQELLAELSDHLKVPNPSSQAQSFEQVDVRSSQPCSSFPVEAHKEHHSKSVDSLQSTLQTRYVQSASEDPPT